MLNMHHYLAKLTEACDRYEKTAPTVEAHCDDLYRRITLTPARVSLSELQMVSSLWVDGQWMHPNLAANCIYHVRHALKMNNTGQAGF
jgi:hypothetical protein